MSRELDISVVGLSCVDCIVLAGEGRRWNVQNPVGDVRISAGGLGNALVALSGLGLRVGVSTRVGADMYGDFLLNRWGELGIDTSQVITDADRATGFAFVVNHDGERTPFYSAGANAAFGLSDIPRELCEDSRCMLLFFAGALPALDGEPMLELVKRCHAAGTTAIMDVSDGITADHGPIRSYLPYANLVVNRVEGQMITGHESPRDILESLAHPGNFMAVTRPDGVSLVTPDGEYLDVPSPCYGRPVRDVVGAGDTFRAGLAAYLVTHDTPDYREACLWASAASYLYLSRNTDIRPFSLHDLEEAANGLPNTL